MTEAHSVDSWKISADRLVDGSGCPLYSRKLELPKGTHYDPGVSIGRKRRIMNELPQRAAHRFAASLRERYGDALVDVQLFGSCARGEMREDSDVDVAVVLQVVDWRTKKDVIDLASEIGLEHDVLLSPTVLDRRTFERWRAQERLLVMDIQREGLPL